MTEQVTRTEVRPGLTRVARRTRMDDGRYLIYYEFERTPSVPPSSVPKEPAV